MTVDPSRLEELEKVLARLQAELSNARREFAALREASATASPARPGARATASPPASATTSAPADAARQPAAPSPGRPGPASARWREPLDLENLAGRYGAIALAVILIVMAAGALVSWAIAHGLLGPAVRVALGVLLALGLAGAGWRLRERGARQYGDALLAIALAVVHVVAWGAGPRLGLVPSWVALLVADFGSLVLAGLALRDGEQFLFCVGFGGALIAPFVTATGEPHYLLLAAYGVATLGAAIGVIGPRPWWIAVTLVVAGVVLYAVSVHGFPSATLWVSRGASPVFAGLIALIALAREEKPVRPWIALLSVTVMAMAVRAPHVARDADSLLALLAAVDVPLVAFGGTALLFAAVRHVEEDRLFGAWLMAIVVVPVLFLGAALSTAGPVGGVVSGGLALVWALSYAIAALAERGKKRGTLLAASGLASMWAVMLVFDAHRSAIPPLVAAHAVLFAAVARREKQPPALIATGTSLAVAFGTAATGILELPGYSPMPFLSVWSAGAACVVVATWMSVQAGLEERVHVLESEVDRERLALIATSILAFVWGHLELRRAFSADASTFLVIAWYAGCGVLAIHEGRRAGEPRVRMTGLALSLFAALYALEQASSVQQIGLRVGSYLLVGFFLLGVAWWYRGAAVTGDD